MLKLVQVVSVVLLTSPAFGQPADCPAEPPATATVPLMLDLRGLPGVPRGVGGYLGADVPVSPPGGTVCGATSPAGSDPSGDVLAGPPGNVLRGPPARDLLRGSVPRVVIDTQ